MWIKGRQEVVRFGVAITPNYRELKMKKSIMVLALMSVCSMAYATGASNNCNGNGSCGETYNTINNTSNQGGNGYGGQGGNGGNSASSAIGTGGNATGGSATAIGVGGSADVRNSSTNLNANTNKVDSSNIQGQIQGQGQKQSTSNSNNSSNTSNVTVEGDNFEAKRIPVNTAYAPAIAPTANCALSVSAGVSVIGFSGSFGKAYIDKECVANEDVRNVALVLGDKETAEAMKCISSETYRKARLSLGRACPVEQE